MADQLPTQIRVKPRAGYGCIVASQERREEEMKDLATRCGDRRIVWLTIREWSQANMYVLVRSVVQTAGNWTKPGLYNKHIAPHGSGHDAPAGRPLLYPDPPQLRSRACGRHARAAPLGSCRHGCTYAHESVMTLGPQVSSLSITRTYRSRRQVQITRRRQIRSHVL